MTPAPVIQHPSARRLRAVPPMPEPPKQVEADQYLTVSPKVQGLAISLQGEVSRIVAELGRPFITRIQAQRLQRRLAEVSTLVEALAKEGPQ